MQNTYTEEFVLRYSECDRYGRMKLKTLFDYAQEIAGAHASMLGVGVELLRPLRRAWFLSRIRVRFAAYPSVGDRVSVTTCPVGFDRLFARREFRFATKELGEFAAATSDWLLVDVSAMRVLSAAREIGDKMPAEATLSATFPELGKLPSVAPDVPGTTRRITATQIDMNGHLNNAEYAAILQDALGIGCYPREFQLNYQKSVPPESELTISGSIDIPAGVFLYSGRLAEGTVAFEASGTILNMEKGENA